MAELSQSAGYDHAVLALRCALLGDKVSPASLGTAAGISITPANVAGRYVISLESSLISAHRDRLAQALQGIGFKLVHSPFGAKHEIVVQGNPISRLAGLITDENGNLSLETADMDALHRKMLPGSAPIPTPQEQLDQQDRYPRQQARQALSYIVGDRLRPRDICVLEGVEQTTNQAVTSIGLPEGRPELPRLLALALQMQGYRTLPLNPQAPNRIRLKGYQAERLASLIGIDGQPPGRNAVLREMRNSFTDFFERQEGRQR